MYVITESSLCKDRIKKRISPMVLLPVLCQELSNLSASNSYTIRMCAKNGDCHYISSHTYKPAITHSKVLRLRNAEPASGGFRKTRKRERQTSPSKSKYLPRIALPHLPILFLNSFPPSSPHVEPPYFIPLTRTTESAFRLHKHSRSCYVLYISNIRLFLHNQLIHYGLGKLLHHPPTTHIN